VSPTKRPSKVSGLRRAVESPAHLTIRSDESIGLPEDIGKLVQPTARTKPVRITVDLSPADYDALNHWIGTAAAQINSAPGQRLTLSKAVRAMLKATIVDKSIGLVVIDLLRQASEQR
jgi:hypothetical protein